jgi:signal transduction histidine kinase
VSPPLFERPAQTTLVLGADRRVRSAGPHAERLLGRPPGEVVGSRVVRVPWSGGRGRVEVTWPDRSIHALEFAATAGLPTCGQFVALRELRAGRGERARRDPKHALIADLRASGRDPPALLAAIGSPLAAALGADRVGVFESAGPARPLVLRAGAGWEDGAVGRMTAPSEADAPVGRALASEDPIIIRDLRRTAPVAPPLEDVVSGVQVAIGPHRPAWGVLGAYTTRPRRFSPDDVDFLAAVADVLALSLDRAAIEWRTRAELAQLLHDEALQSMLAARQYLAPPAGERAIPAREAVQRAIRELRAIVGDVHPIVADRVPLRAAIAAAVEDTARRGGLETTLELELDDGAGWASLLLSLTRELVANVVEHAGARRLNVSLRRAGERIVLEVADDGSGMAPERVEQAVAAGHIGLASAASRIAAIGGKLTIDSAPGAGTRVGVELPGPAAGGAGTGAS